MGPPRSLHSLPPEGAAPALGRPGGSRGVPDGVLRHAGMVDFIARHYAQAGDGRWYVQNGPQQVFVSLDYSPYILHLTSSEQLETHTGLPVTAVSGAWLDEEGCLILVCEHGAALVDDRDLATFAGHLDGDPEAGPLSLIWGGCTLPVGHITQAELPARYGFVRG